MALVHMYSVVDAKTGVYAAPFVLLTDGQAMRSFIDSAKDEKSMFFAHPEDFSLVRLGDFDDSLGLLVPLPVPLVLMTASQAVA